VVIVPSGYLGNASAAMWARKTGMPISTIVLAMNANRAVADYFQSGEWKPLPTIATLANAMDVGNPSNMERVMALYPELSTMRAELRVVTVSDVEIRETIAREARAGHVYCPHTATARFARAKLAGESVILVATAHPAKFESIVEPLVGQAIPVPPELGRLLARPSSAEEIEPVLTDLRRALENGNF
jgi:threonine synthase